jgi:hypothetical protein
LQELNDEWQIEEIEILKEGNFKDVNDCAVTAPESKTGKQYRT